MIKIVLIIMFVIFIYIYIQISFSKTNFVKINSKKILPNSSIKILQISDYHNSPFNSIKSQVLKSIKKEMPDLIVITGDLIDAKTQKYDNVYNFIEEIVKLNSDVYFINGNHEWRNENTKKFMCGLKIRKVNILNNSNKLINIRGNEFNLCGIDDFNANRSDIIKSFYGINEKLFTIVLSHSPDIILNEKNFKGDLILTGHTHGGQVRLPFIGAIMAPGQEMFPKYSKGLYNIYKDILLYIDSGIGTSRIPIRLFNRSQISLISIRGNDFK